MIDPYDGFTVNVYLDEEGDWLAHFVERPEVSAFAQTPDGALRELASAWAAVKATYQEEGLIVPAAPRRQRRAAG